MGSLSALLRGRRRSAIIVGGCLLAHALLLGWQAYGDSTTWDEVGHFAAGLDHWKHGRFEIYPVNPPLVRLVGLAPVALAPDAPDPAAYRAFRSPGRRLEFGVGASVFQHTGPRCFFLLSLARCACIPFSLLGLWVCFRWAANLWGPAAGEMAAALWAFSPSVLAYGHLIAPDMGAAGLGVCAMYLFRGWLLRPTWGRAAAAGAALGLAELTKTTWLVLFILWPIAWAMWRVARPRPGPRAWLAQGAQLVGMLFAAVWVLNLGYGFESSFRPLGEFRFLSHALRGDGPEVLTYDGVPTGNRFAGSWVGRLPAPVPANYLLGIDFVKWEYEYGYWSYLRGEWRHGGWWYYYLYAALVKEPLGTWGLALLAGVALLARRRDYAAPARDELLLILPGLAVIVLVSSQTGFNHHLRYILPAFPFAFIWVSRLARAFELRHRGLAIAAVICLGGSIVSSLSVVPHSLSYFNELAGGPKGGPWHLGNSNADWGQDLLYLKRWYDRHPEARPLHLGYDLPIIDPRILSIQWLPLPPGPTPDNSTATRPEDLGPLPGWYAVSVNQLHSRGGEFDYFREVTPIDRVGYTLPIYHLTLEQANALRRRQGMPEVPPDQPAPSGPAAQQP